MDINALLARHRKECQQQIEKVFPREFSRMWLKNYLHEPKYALSYDINALNEALSKPVYDLLDRKGKMWRPGLMLLCAQAVTKKSEKEVVKKITPLVPIVELLHNGSLVADDIEDRSEMRRGKEALHKIYGEDVAINAGNALYFFPFLVLFRNLGHYDEKTRLAVYDIVTENMLKLHLGQALDIHWHNHPDATITEKHYLQMCMLKTGCLSSTAAKLGAAVMGGSRKEVAALEKFGHLAGVAFQIQDDILNVKPSEQWRKVKGEDITEGKMSLMVVHTLSKATPADRERLLSILKRHTAAAEDIDEAIALLEKYRAIAYAKARAASLIQDAVSSMKKDLKQSDARQQLLAFADYMITRDF